MMCAVELRVWFGGRVGCVTTTNRFDFGEDPDPAYLEDTKRKTVQPGWVMHSTECPLSFILVWLHGL